MTKSQTVRTPTLSTNQNFAMPKGTQGWVSAYVAPSLNEAGVYLRFKTQAIGDRIFAALQDDKEEIERAVGIPVNWNSDEKFHTIAATRKFTNKLLEKHAPELQKFLADIRVSSELADPSTGSKCSCGTHVALLKNG